MKSFTLAVLYLFLSSISLFSQETKHRKFPQQQINAHFKHALQKQASAAGKELAKKNKNDQNSIHSPHSNLRLLNETTDFIHHKLPQVQWAQNGDTIFVGVTPNDTLRITGYWTHEGPIYVFGTGVLIFDHATVIDTGDIYVFQTGKLFADSSSLTFPQQYFYQRSLQILENGYAQINNCSFNYSGMSHNLVLAHAGQLYMNNIHQNDWTTCGLYGQPTISVNGCNISGEYVITDSCNISFSHADTLLLWHHLPIGANINYSFPAGDTVYNYQFNNLVSGVSGVNYHLTADSCHNVMWALMPENGTSVTISNSDLRAIGAWFRYGDITTVSGLFDSTMYTSSTLPLTDRMLQLNNTYVQTWSLYAFDSSAITLSNCQVGEVGAQQRATINQSNPFLLDGTGGYYWTTDTSFAISFGAMVYTTVRAEKSSFFIMAYDWVPFTAPSAIAEALLVYIQSESNGDPVAYDAGTVWMDKLDGPDTSFTNTVVPVTGSAWIDWAPAGTGWMDFANYSLYYQLQGNTTWTKIVGDSALELHHGVVANWNTNGLSAGDYLLKLTCKNIYGDSVEAMRPIHLNLSTQVSEIVSNSAGIFNVFPNPANQSLTYDPNGNSSTSVEIFNVLGELVLTERINQNGATSININGLEKGIYLIKAGQQQKTFVKN